MNGFAGSSAHNVSKSIQRLGKVGGWEYDVVNDQLSWTEEVYRILGLSQSYMPTIDKGLNFYTKHDRQVLENYIGNAIDHGQAFVVEATIINAEGKSLYTRSNGTPIIENGRVTKVVGAFQDISDQQSLLIEAKRSREAYERVAKDARAMIWRAETSSNRLYSISSNCLEVTGYSVHEWLAPQFWEDHIHPDDRDSVLEKSKQSLQNGADHILEYRLRKSDGSWMWVVDSVSVTANPEQPSQLVGVILDTDNLVQARRESLLNAEKLESVYRQTLETIVATIEKRDPYTAGHMFNVAQLCKTIGSRLGLDKQTLEGLTFAARIHDIGKIYLPAEILHRPGKLSEQEFSLIKTHTNVGYDIVKNIDFPWPVKELVRSHHERLDGSGYPDGLKGDEISLEVRILAVADVVEAFSALRPYRAAKSLEDAKQLIIDKSGVWFDPEVVRACVDIIDEKLFTPSG
ncbi:MAG: PAS domain-containing protein [Pseudohongiellaceae bacterium]|nr:PAS domain-containing protein [Pseudohongiellaceae bacterium]